MAEFAAAWPRRLPRPPKAARAPATAPSERQLEILAFIARGLRTGLPVSIRDICKRFGFASTNAAHLHITVLRGFGLLKPGRPKRYALLEPTTAGWVAAKVELCAHCHQPIPLEAE